ncbi:MAG: hypothetical protein FWD83_01985, partial [Promicromonosporaceae bacterium]|nr:hypothetical protein [Promicromonosporaceae bacterium]
TWSGCDGHDGPVGEVIETLTLAPGESLTCRGTLNMGTATTHQNTLTVTAVGVQTGTEVSDVDVWELAVVHAGIAVTKTSAAGDPALLVVAPGVMPSPVEVAFTITNTGTEAKRGLTFTDETLTGPAVAWSACDGLTGDVASALAGLTLAPGASVTCHGTLSMSAARHHQNVLTVTGLGAKTGTEVTATDDWRLDVTVAGIKVVKTSPVGDPALIPVAPGLAPKPVEVIFTITNLGTEAKHGFTWNNATIDGPDVTWTSCDGHTGTVDEAIAGLRLEAGEALTCRGTLAVAPPYHASASSFFAASQAHVQPLSEANHYHGGHLTVTAVGAETGTSVRDADEWWADVILSKIEVVKTSPLGDPAFQVRHAAGEYEPVEVTFTVTNLGGETMSHFTWEDVTTEGPAVTWATCDGHSGTVDEVIADLRLEVGESITCHGTLDLGAARRHSNVLTVIGLGEITGGWIEGEGDWELTVLTGVCEKASTAHHLHPGETTSHTWTIFNGEDHAMPISATTDLSAALVYTDLVPGSIRAMMGNGASTSDITGEVKLVGDLLTWSGVIPAGSTIRVTYDLRANEPVNGAVGLTVVTETQVGPCSVPLLITATPEPGLKLVKTSPAGDPAILRLSKDSPLTPVVVTFTLTNTGNVPLSSLTWYDVTIEGPDVAWASCEGHVGTVAEVIAGLTLAAGEAVTCRGTLTMGAALSHQNVLVMTGTYSGTGVSARDADEWRLIVDSPPSGGPERDSSNDDTEHNPSAVNPERDAMPHTGAPVTFLAIITVVLLAIGITLKHGRRSVDPGCGRDR